MKVNLFTAVSYLPIVGIITAIFRLRTTSNFTSPALKASLCFRAVVEFIGAGFLLLIPDLLVTIGRHCCQKEVLFREVS